VSRVSAESSNNRIAYLFRILIVDDNRDFVEFINSEKIRTKGKSTMIGKLLRLTVVLTLIISTTESLLLADQSDGGEQLYLRYCSSCHGADGKGNGPVASHLKVKVPDLTLLTKRHKSTYPLDEVMATIDGRRAVRAHGDRNMPVWGEKFRSETEGKKYSELTTLVKERAIAEYVSTLQRK